MISCARGLTALAVRGIAHPPSYEILLDIYASHVYIYRMGNYSKNVGAVFNLKLHIVWCPKYRRKVLTELIAQRLKQLLYEKADELEFTIHALEIMPDHVHLFLEHDPTRCVAEIANRFKGYSSRVLRREFPELRRKLPTLWSRSYFAASIGSATETAIRKYIEEQKGK